VTDETLSTWEVTRDGSGGYVLLIHIPGKPTYKKFLTAFGFTEAFKEAQAIIKARGLS
jgi:hypothetical protein